MLEKISKPVDVDEVAVLLLRHYGLDGALLQISGERDYNFSLTTNEGGRFIVKIAHEDEAIETLECQSHMIARIVESASHLPVSREILNQHGSPLTVAALENGTQRYMRVNAFLPGIALSDVPRTTATRRATGELVASLAHALEGFDHSAAHRKLLWDIQQAGLLRDHVQNLPEEARSLATHYLDRFTRRIAPRAHELRHGAIHNDLNLHNLLVDSHNHDLITGCIDFGDMVWAPLVNDLAIATAYQLDPSKPLESIVDVASAYHHLRPLTPLEIDFLPDLVAMRFVLTLAITHWRSKLHPENVAYILRNAPAALMGLQTLKQIHPETARDYLYSQLLTVQDIAQ